MVNDPIVVKIRAQASSNPAVLRDMS